MIGVFAKIRQIVAVQVLAVAMLLPVGLALAAPAPVLAADSKSAACAGIGLTGGDCKGDTGSSVNNLVKTIVDILSWVVGVAAVIMIIIAGLKYITANGDAGSISSAKNTLIYAVIGLVVVILAQVIVNFVIDTTVNGF